MVVVVGGCWEKQVVVCAYVPFTETWAKIAKRKIQLFYTEEEKLLLLKSPSSDLTATFEPILTPHPKHKHTHICPQTTPITHNTTPFNKQQNL